MLKVVTVVAAALAILLTAGAAGGKHRKASRSAVVVAGGGAYPVTVPPSFLGLSIEWDSVEAYAGRAGHRRPRLVRLLGRLSRAMGSPLALRVGGNSADQAWWNPRGRRRPPRILHNITPATLDALAWLARELGGPVALGLNLARNDPRNALALARAAQRRLPPGTLETLEIGNEPDLYTVARTFRVPGRVHRRLRKYRRYSPRRYVRDVRRYLAVLQAGLQPVPRLSVAGFARRSWWRSLPRALRTWGDSANALSAHRYAIPCDGPPPPMSWLVSAGASRGLAAGLAPLARLARRHRVPMRVTELNSAACGGRAGLSDRFGAALWLADTLFAVLRKGAQQAHVHTWHHARYAPFRVRGRRVVARPPFLGMLAFAAAAPSGSRLVHARASGGVRAWATVDAGGTTRVALIVPRRGKTVAVKVAAGGPCATLWRAARGRAVIRSVCGRPGRYRVRMPARSIGVVMIPPAGSS